MMMRDEIQEQIEEMRGVTGDAVAHVKCQYLLLAAAIMRECAEPGMADDIDQVRYALAGKVRGNRKHGKDSCLNSFVKGSTGEYEANATESLRKWGRDARIDECRSLLEQLLQQYGYSPKAATVILLARRIRELEEQAEERTDNANRTEG